MRDAIQQVQQLYERRPYPHYPLLAKPRWQDGYLGSSLFAQSLINGSGFDPSGPRNFLSIGSGEILPYIIRQWEPSATRLDCVDLSRRSIHRAQFRTALLGRRLAFHCEDINSLLLHGNLSTKQFDHIEAYGVLHHIPQFALTLNLIRQHLSRTGILRIMIYNAGARDWIWQLNRAFQCLNLRFESDHDVARARDLLKEFAKISPRLAYRLNQLGTKSLENNTRFADTFLHPWESRASIKTWFETFSRAELRPVALFDRYAELDDVPNPLWQCPTTDELFARAQDLRFENNLELWLTRSDAKRPTNYDSALPLVGRKIPVRLRLTMPPGNFDRFTETADLTIGAKLTLWHGFLRNIHGMSDPQNAKLIRELAPNTAGRLARIGLILPAAARECGRYDELLAPLASTMAPPILPEASNDLALPNIRKLCAGIRSNPQKVEQAVKRIIRVL